MQRALIMAILFTLLTGNLALPIHLLTREPHSLVFGAEGTARTNETATATESTDISTSSTATQQLLCGFGEFDFSSLSSTVTDWVYTDTTSSTTYHFNPCSIVLDTECLIDSPNSMLCEKNSDGTRTSLASGDLQSLQQGYEWQYIEPNPSSGVRAITETGDSCIDSGEPRVSVIDFMCSVSSGMVNGTFSVQTIEEDGVCRSSVQVYTLAACDASVFLSSTAEGDGDDSGGVELSMVLVYVLIAVFVSILLVVGGVCWYLGWQAQKRAWEDEQFMRSREDPVQEVWRHEVHGVKTRKTKGFLDQDYSHNSTSITTSSRKPTPHDPLLQDPVKRTSGF